MLVLVALLTADVVMGRASFGLASSFSLFLQYSSPSSTECSHIVKEGVFIFREIGAGLRFSGVAVCNISGVA